MTKFLSPLFQKITMLLSCLLLVGCGPDEFGIFWQPSANDNLMVGKKQSGRYFVSGDEPYAVLIGNKIFLEGGNAVDAAVATAIAMAATQPLNTSLGAGGACQGFLPDEDNDLALYAVSFTGAKPSSSMASALYQIHAKHGNLRWEKMVAPAEKLIRIGFADNAATRLHASNPFWQRDDSNLIVMPQLAESLSNLRVRPISFIFGNKAGTMNHSYRAAGLDYNKKMTRKKAMKTITLKPIEKLRKKKIKNDMQVAVARNQGLTGYGKRWANYMNELANYDGDDGKKKPRRPARAGLNLQENAVMAIDGSGQALTCHFSIGTSANNKPIQAGTLGFFAPHNGLKFIAARGFFILDSSDDPIGILSAGQSVRGVACDGDIDEDIFEDSCQWARNETGIGLSIKGNR